MDDSPVPGGQRADDEIELDLGALDALVPDAGLADASGLSPQSDPDKNELDADALEALVGERKHANHSVGHMAMMRDRLAQKRLLKMKGEVKHAQEQRRSDSKAIAMVSTAAARASGVSVQKRIKVGEVVSDGVALALLRCGFSGGAGLMSEGQHTFVYRVEAFLCDMMLRRQAAALNMLVAVMQQFREAGFSIALGFNFEQDAAKMTLKSSGGGALLNDTRRRLRAVASRDAAGRAKREATFQHGACDSLLSMSGRVVLAATRGDEVYKRTFHWHHPPVALPDGSSAALGAALLRMPIRPSMAVDWGILCQFADVVLGLACQDKAGSNVAHSSLVRDVVEASPAQALFEEEWCSMSALMKSSSYVDGAIGRLQEHVNRNLVRHTDIRPSSEDLALNRTIVDALYSLDAPHHLRHNVAGQPSKSNLLHDLEDLLALDRGSWRSPDIVCYCWDESMGQPLHPNREVCVDSFVMLYARVYLGSPWPLPSVTKFTNMSIVTKKVQLAYAHHDLLRVILEPFVYNGEPLPSVLATRSSISEFAETHRARKHDVYHWAVCDPWARWQVPILAQLTDVLDRVMYCHFNQSGNKVPAHQTFEIVSSVQNALLRLLSEWSDASSSAWPLVDATAGLRRSSATEEVKLFLRSNLLLWAASLLRRYELPLHHHEYPLHLMVCDVCSPGAEAKRAAWLAFQGKPACCKSFFARRLSALCAESGCGDRMAERALQLRQELQMSSTKVSEAQHAHGQKVLCKSQKPLSLATFARKAFLARVRASHLASGGNPAWPKLSDDELVRRSHDKFPLERILMPSGDCVSLSLLGGGESALGGDIVSIVADLPQEQQKPRHLNPVLVAFNARQRTAKQFGVKVDAAWKEQAMVDLKRAYQDDPAARQAMRRDYDRFLHAPQAQGSQAVAEPLRSTYWGWGAEQLPIPIEAVQEHVRERGLPSSDTVWSRDAEEIYRVTAEEAAEVPAATGGIKAAACGASAFNECRRALYIVVALFVLWAWAVMCDLASAKGSR